MAALVYALISLGNTILTGVMSGWLIYFYIPPVGNPLVMPGLFGLAVLASRVGHIFTTILTERMASRATWRPLLYMVGGALAIPGLFVLLWVPPHSTTSMWNLLQLGLILIAFNAATGVHQVAYESLLPRFALGEKERNAVSTWRMAFLLAGNVLAGLAGPFIEAVGYLSSMWIFASTSALLLIPPGLFLSRYLRRDGPAMERTPFLEHVKAALSNPNFRIFSLSWGLMWLATTFTLETLPYIVTEICRLTKADTAWFYFSTLVTGVIAYPVVMKLAKRYGAKIVFRTSLLAGAFAMPGLMLIDEHIPVPLFAQGLVWIILQTICLTGAQALPGAITAEIIAGDPQKQSSLYAFGNLIDQFSSGLALAIIPFFLLVGRSMSDAAGPLGVRWLALAGSLFLLASFGVFGFYRPKKQHFSK